MYDFIFALHIHFQCRLSTLDIVLFLWRQCFIQPKWAVYVKKHKNGNIRFPFNREQKVQKSHDIMNLDENVKTYCWWRQSCICIEFNHFKENKIKLQRAVQIAVNLLIWLGGGLCIEVKGSDNKLLKHHLTLYLIISGCLHGIALDFNAFSHSLINVRTPFNRKLHQVYNLLLCFSSLRMVWKF